MAVLHKTALDNYLQNPSDSYHIILLFGPDRGHVAERACILFQNLQALYDIEADDPFSVVKISAEDLNTQPQRLISEAYTIPFLGSKRLIHVKGYGLKTLAKFIAPLLDRIPEDSIIVIEADDLKKSSGLRKSVEIESCALAIPCYADDHRTLNELISGELNQFNLKISSPARQFLASQLGSDRLVSRGEVVKLCLYASDKETIELDDVVAVIGDNSALEMNQLFDHAALGQKEMLIEHLNRLSFAPFSIYQLNTLALRHFQNLHKARILVENGLTTVQAVEKLSPPIFFKRKEAVIRQLEFWSLTKLERALELLSEMIFQSRLQPSLASALMGDILIRIAGNAKR